MNLHEFVMRRASEILFWVSILLFIGTAGSSLLNAAGVMAPYGEATGIGPRLLFLAIVEGMINAVWPFFGAGLIWAIKSRQGASE